MKRITCINERIPVNNKPISSESFPEISILPERFRSLTEPSDISILSDDFNSITIA